MQRSTSPSAAADSLQRCSHLSKTSYQVSAAIKLPHRERLMPGAHVLTVAKRALQSKISLCCTATAATTSACYTRLTVSLGKVDCTTAPQHVAPLNGTASSCICHCTCHFATILHAGLPKPSCCYLCCTGPCATKLAIHAGTKLCGCRS